MAALLPRRPAAGSKRRPADSRASAQSGHDGQRLSACGQSAGSLWRRLRTGWERQRLRSTPARMPQGFTLLELLIVVVLVGILASVVVPASRRTSPQLLQTTATTLAAQLRYARSLAIERAADVAVRLDPTENVCHVSWATSEPAGDELPVTLTIGGVRSGYGTSTVWIAAIVSARTGQPVQSFTFHSTGTLAPEHNQDILVWLASGVGEDQRFIQLRIDWVTGFVWIGPPTRTLDVESM